MAKHLYLVVFVLLSGMISSCSKDDSPEVDKRNQYVGTWNAKQRGHLTIYYLGEALQTIPINEDTQMDITLYGEKDLNIGGRVFYLNGNRLTSDPESITNNENGVTMVGTAVYNGVASTEVITLNSEITGSWSNSHGANGEFSGSVVYTLTK